MNKRAEEAALKAYPKKCTNWVWEKFKDSDSYQRERKACQKVTNSPREKHLKE